MHERGSFVLASFKLEATSSPPGRGAAPWLQLWAPFAFRFPDTVAALGALPHSVHSVLIRDFFRVHLAYFVLTTVAAGALIARLDGLGYVDCWLVSTGAMTGGSLTSFDVALLSRRSEVVLWFLMTFGGITATGLWPLSYRLWSYRRRWTPALRKLRRLGAELRRTSSLLPASVAGSATNVSAVLEAVEAADADTLLDELMCQDEGLAAVAVVTAAYTLFWQIVTPLALYCSVAQGRDVALLAELQARGIPLGWFALYMGTSAFNNVGLSILSTSAVPLADNLPALLTLAAATIAGNTGWPCALRLLLRMGAECGESRVFGRLVPSRLARGCRYALTHPQRVYHLLFPPPETAALLGAVALTNLFQLAVLLGSSGTVAALRDGRSATHASALAFFQVTQTRATGFAVVLDFNALAPAVLVVTGFMMWWSAYPLVALWAHSEEGSVFSAGAAASAVAGAHPQDAFPVLASFWRRYVSRHVTWLWIALLTIAAAEAPLLSWQPDGSPPGTNLFAVLFEILSAYGTNGLSLGHPSAVNASLCGAFHSISKVTLIVVMYIGRHRTLPRKIDPPLAEHVATAERLVEAARKELAARGMVAGKGSMLARASGIRSAGGAQGNLLAALAFIRAQSEETLAEMARGSQEQRNTLVQAALERHTPLRALREDEEAPVDAQDGQ